MKFQKLRVLEFFIIGVIVGILEDILAIFFATDVKITWHVILVAALVAIPFALVSEFIVDHPTFWKTLLPKRFYKHLKKKI